VAPDRRGGIRCPARLHARNGSRSTIRPVTDVDAHRRNCTIPKPRYTES
jgi:hypothetical protein